MNKKEKENKLVANAETELQKTQQLVESDFVKTQLQSFVNNKLRQDIIIRDDLLKDDREVSDKLLDRIEGREEALNSILLEINDTEVQYHNALSLSKICLEALRAVNPAKADQLENSVRMIQKEKKSQNKNKRK
ncbi:hypothetical protein [Colwellia piezophila]|uniref:hypothetical protein n=1 Tax=Colwellia piezophila TaxID=211668 RepID=UPI0003759F84|nr:hypothetical protein [Colwellia piezophila]